MTFSTQKLTKVINENDIVALFPYHLIQVHFKKILKLLKPDLGHYFSGIPVASLWCN